MHTHTHTHTTLHINIFYFAGFESMQWQIPVTIATSKNRSALTFVLDKPSTTITLEGLGANDWVLVREGFVTTLLITLLRCSYSLQYTEV